MQSLMFQFIQFGTKNKQVLNSFLLKQFHIKKYKNFQDTKSKHRIDLSLKVTTDDKDANDSSEWDVVSSVNLF